MMTIVLCPSEKKRPHVTDICPSPIRPLVALSIALFKEVVNFAGIKRIAVRLVIYAEYTTRGTGNEPWFHLPDVICIQSFEFQWNIVSSDFLCSKISSLPCRRPKV